MKMRFGRITPAKFTNRVAWHEAGHAVVSCIQNLEFEYVSIDCSPDFPKQVRCLRDPEKISVFAKQNSTVDEVVKEMRVAQAGMEAERLFCKRYLTDSIGREIIPNLGESLGLSTNGTDGDFVGKALDYICGPYIKEQAHVEQWCILTVRRWLMSKTDWVGSVAMELLKRRTLTQDNVRNLEPSSNKLQAF